MQKWYSDLNFLVRIQNFILLYFTFGCDEMCKPKKKHSFHYVLFSDLKILQGVRACPP
jgi:hypothetical protein